MARLPEPGKDSGTWGDILNDYLSQVHKPDGSLKDNTITSSTIAPDAITANEIQDGSITEVQLDAATQAKLNAAAGIPEWDDITNKPGVIAAGADQTEARTAIGAGTSNLTLGTTNVTAKAGDYQPDSGDISDATATGRALLTADDAVAARSTIGAGTSNLSLAGNGSAGTAAKSDHGHSKADIGLNNADNTSDANKPISTATQTALNGKADLVGGKVPTSQLPTITLTDVVVVADEDEMLDLISAQVQPGDVAVRTDGAGSFILTDTDPSTLGNWTLLNAPANTVTSVNGQQGTITLGKGDVGLANADNTSDANKPISTATQSALNGKADLVGGVVPASQLPALALTSTVVVASQSAMLALTTAQVQPGDIAVRTDGAGSFILTATDPSVPGNWTLLNTPGDAVSSVNGQTGTVSITKSSVGLANADNTSDADKPISTAQQSALNLKADASAVAEKLDITDLDTQTAAQINASTSSTAGALAHALSVRNFGAVGNGAVNDALAFNAAIAFSKTVRVPAGVYRLDSSITLPAGQIIYFEPGVVIRAGAAMASAIFNASGVDGVQIVGNGVVIDLNNVTDRAIRLRGVSDLNRGKRFRVTDVYVTNRSSTNPSTAQSAVEFYWAQGPVARNIQVDSYAYGNAAGAEQGYALGFFLCTDPKVEGLRVTNGCVGLEIYQCDDIQVSKFTIRNCIDNGIYILGGSTSVNLSQGRVDDCEEGIVVRSDDVSMSLVKITNCTNKGVTLRVGSRCKISNCHFSDNLVHIGDDANGDPTTYLKISDSTFWDSVDRAIYLNSTTDSEFENLTIVDSSATYAGGVIRLNNAHRCTIRNSRFNVAADKIAIRLSHATQDAVISNNVFIQCGTAVSLFDSSGNAPSGTHIIDNRYSAVTSKLIAAGTATGTVTREAQ